jgi:hypothetical protein
MMKTYASIVSDVPSRDRPKSQLQETAEEDYELEYGWYKRHCRIWRPINPISAMESTPFRFTVRIE